MRAPDDLTRAFCRAMPDRIAQATELWLGMEEGQAENLPVLRRLLHTLKGEAHMLELSVCGELAHLAESLVDAVHKGAPLGSLTGDAILGAFDGMSVVSSVDLDEPPDVDPLLEQLHAALEELARAEAASPRAPSPAPQEAAPGERPASSPPQRHEVSALDAEEVRPVLHEMRRLYGEQKLFEAKLREAQRMLRALLVELDPRRSPETLVERITKTLGYGTEVDRQMSAIRAEWSENEFALGLSLDELDATVRRASVVGTDRLLNQVVRVGRSTARTLNKDVEVRTHGNAIMDALVEQRLEAALLHLVRNAIDHGIESSELRVARGKPPRGLIQVSISQTESSISVEVADDGGGVNFVRLRELLRAQGVDVDALEDDALLPQLLFQGVSTAENVSAISGRGVGLDVVAREIAAAGGQVRIQSKPGLGTTFTLVLPLTLRGELAVPLWSGKQRYAVPCRSVHSVVRPERIEHTGDEHWIRVEQEGKTELVRLHSLDMLFGSGDGPKQGEAVVVLHHSGGLFAVSVEGYDNPRAITLQRSEELPFRSPLVRGVAPMPEGGVLLLLDVEALHGSARGRSGLGRGRNAAARRQPRALVVEDAPVARELLSGILRSIGLRVEEATDGRQGLALARSQTPDLVLTDIEMPYMDGIEMVSEFRRSSTLARVPVIVLTTAATPENWAKLEKLNISALLSKQKFVEADLRNLIAKCLTSPS